MPTELKNIDVHFISLVKKGANRKHIIVKSPDFEADNATFSRLIKIEKIDSPKRMIYGLVYSPNADNPDTDGEFATVEEIEKSCERFMRRGGTADVDVRHSWEREDGVFVKESWIVKSADPLFPEEEGAWAVGIKVEKDELWTQVEAGDIGGLSLGGYCEKVEKTQGADMELAEKEKNLSFMAKLGGAMRSVIQKESMTFDEVVDRQEFWSLFWALEDSFYRILDDEDLDHTGRMAKVAESIDQFKDKFKTLKTEKVDASLIEKEGRMFSKANYEKLVGVMETLQKLIGEAQTEKSNKEEEQMELEKLEKALTDLGTRVEELEKVETPPETPAAEEPSALEKSLKEIAERVEKLEGSKEDPPAVAPEVEALQKSLGDIAERLEKIENPEAEATEKSEEVQAVEKSLEAVVTRLEKIEKARGISQKGDPEPETPAEPKGPMTGPITPKVKHFG